MIRKGIQVLRPNAVGWIVLIYIGAHLWEWAWSGFGFYILLKWPEQVDLFAFIFYILPVLYFLSYLVGGIGLIALQRWASLLVLSTAVVELIFGIVILVSSFVANVEHYGWSTTFSFILFRLIPLLVPGAIAYMALSIHRRADVWQLPPRAMLMHREVQRGPGESNLLISVFWAIILVGAILPWIVGLMVGLYRPNFPWSYFKDNLALLILVSIWFDLPYIILAYAARSLLSKSFWGLESYGARLVFISLGFLGGCIGTVMTFVNFVFGHGSFDPEFVLEPLWIFYIPPMLAGLFLGFLIARILQKYPPKIFHHA